MDCQGILRDQYVFYYFTASKTQTFILYNHLHVPLSKDILYIYFSWFYLAGFRSFSCQVFPAFYYLPFTKVICLSSFSWGFQKMLTKNRVTHKSSQPLHLRHIVFTSIVQSLPGWYVTYLNTIQSRIFCLISRLCEKNVPNDSLKLTNTVVNSLHLHCSNLINKENVVSLACSVF